MEKKKSCNLKTKSKGFLLLACILLVLLRFKINRVSATGFTHIQYNGNFFFESNSSGAVSGGNGTEENPYIIENLVFSMANESESPVAINISNTDVHFIIRYCAIYDLRENTSVHGILFNNVTNGKIQDVDFNQWNYENRYRAAWCGIVLENSTNCTISGTRVGWIDHGWPYQENRFTLGILLKNTNYSTIIGNTISATLGIILQSSNYNNISSNLVTNKNSTEYELKYGAGVYPTTYPEIVLVGVRLDNDCHYNLINDNQIYPYWDHAIYLRDETNRYNTIINNYNLSRDSRYNMVTGAKGGPHVEINSMAQPNYLFKIKKPENKTYTGPVTPAPGYYASSERFETLENGISLTMLQNGWWRYVTGSCGIISNKTDASGYDHAKVVHFSSTGGLFKYLPEASEGTLEFWINKDIIGTGNVTWKLQSYKWLEPAQVLFTMGADLAAANELSFSDGAGWHSGIPFQDDKWYRFSIDFSMSGGYKGLGSKQYQFRIFDSDGVRILHESIVANFTDDGYVDDEWLIFNMSISGDTGLVNAYLDAFGYTWNPAYDEGDNSLEGMWLDYDRQEEGFTWDEIRYQVDDGSQKTFHKEGITWGSSNKSLIIPLPKDDGTHKIVVIGKDNGQNYYSDKVYFTTWYESYLNILNHIEDGCLFAQNNTFISSGAVALNPALDFIVNITYQTYFVDKSRSTWTNASYYYKINGDPADPSGWSGPNIIDYDNGTINTSFSIGAVNFNDFDHVYYYLSFQQYDNNSKFMKEYFWTSDGLIEYDQEEARAAAFHKKVAPIPYELTLNYSMFYQAQVAETYTYVNGTNSTIYPLKPLSYNNLSINFYNLTYDQINYSVECVNESQLDHTMYSTGNITKAANPTFLLGDGIMSPFILPLNMTYTLNTSEITLPLMFFDDKLSANKNLIFTGDLINLTYVRDENFPIPSRKVMVFSHVTPSIKATVFFDFYTRVMVYLDYVNSSVTNARERLVLALFNTNQSYQVNQEIVMVPEINDTGTILLNDTLLGILYDPPGDNSYSEIKTGTTLTMGFAAELATSQGFFFQMEALAGAFGATVGVGTEFSFAVTTTEGMEAEMSITIEKAMTSSLNTDDPLLIGPGRGDLYYGGAIVVEWQLIMDVYYLANRTNGANSTTLDFIEVWKNGSHVEYSPGIDASFSALGAYLDSYNLSHLHNQNPFIDNEIGAAESNYVEIIGDPLLWTPNYATELSQSMTSAYTRSKSVEIELDLAVYAAWDVEVDRFVTVKTNGRVGISFGMQFGITTTSTTEVNKDIMAHLEDDDGTPIGEHDQFLTQMYIDKRYGTYGFITHRDSTYTSYPHEFGTKDRRSPIASELLSVDEWLHGNTTLQALAADDETGVKMVEFYWDNVPLFLDGISTRIGYATSATSGNIYECIWDTTIIPTSYGEEVYLFAVTSDNAGVNYSNTKVSAPYPVRIDNAAPTRCSLIAYTPYEKIIPLYASVLDGESGIDHVKYWLGVPSSPGSRLLGSSNDPSDAYRFLWATDPGGADDGIKRLYAVAYDKAGNSLTSAPLEINVENVKFLTPQAETAIIAGATAGGAGVGTWVLSKTLSGIFKKAFAKKKKPQR